MTTETIQFKVSGLMCSFCTMSVENALKRNTSVRSVLINLVHGIVLVEAETSKISREEITTAIENLGYVVSGTEVQQYARDEDLFKLIKQRGSIGMFVSIVDLVIDPINMFSLHERTRGQISLCIAAFVLLWVGQPILKKTLLAIGQRVINANVLLSAGAWGSFAIGVFSLFDPRWPNYLPVASWLMSLHLFFGYFKLDTRRKASEAVKKMLSLQPSNARVARGEGIVLVAAKDVCAGEIVQVLPGERIPLDGVVIDGNGSVDESGLTGESLPSAKEPGAMVIGGTLNLDGALTVRVTSVEGASFLQQIVKLMTRITENKPSIELLADRLMNYYGPIVFTVATFAFFVWAIESGNLCQATIVFITTIIMGYPCALGIATPMVAAIAGGKGMSIGLLIKASEMLHGLSIVDAIAFDKTGTLTYGKPTVTDVLPYDVSPRELLSIAGSIESLSEHPTGKAIHFMAKKEGAELSRVEGFRAFPGKGVLGNVDGLRVVAGNLGFLRERKIPLGDDLEGKVAGFAREGKTTIAIARSEKVIGLIALQDTPRRGAEQVIKHLRDRGIKTVMLTGDIHGVAHAMAQQLGIEEVQSQLLPQEKVAAIESLQARGFRVAMVGDGINDAPALAQSDVGIAIGAGTDVAIEAAGVILLGDRLDDVVGALTLGKASHWALQVNVATAVFFNIAGMGLAAFGYVTPAIAIILMVLSIFVILLNTLRIRNLKIRSDRPEAAAEPIAEIEFSVPQMHCGGCAEKITLALSSVKGIREVKPKVNQRRVYIQYEPDAVKEDDVRSLLEKAGFSAAST